MARDTLKARPQNAHQGPDSAHLPWRCLFYGSYNAVFSFIFEPMNRGSVTMLRPTPRIFEATHM